MDANTRKTISIVCLCFSILWFALIVIFESHYLFGVFRHEKLRHVIRTVYEDQIDGINFVMMVVYLIPGIFGLVLYRRFKKDY